MKNSFPSFINQFPEPNAMPDIKQSIARWYSCNLDDRVEELVSHLKHYLFQCRQFIPHLLIVVMWMKNLAMQRPLPLLLPFPSVSSPWVAPVAVPLHSVLLQLLHCCNAAAAVLTHWYWWWSPRTKCYCCTSSGKLRILPPSPVHCSPLKLSLMARNWPPELNHLELEQWHSSNRRLLHSAPLCICCRCDTVSSKYPSAVPSWFCWRIPSRWHWFGLPSCPAASRRSSAAVARWHVAEATC